LKGKITDRAKEFGLNKITGGRAVVSGHILSDNIDIFAANERGVNFLYKNIDGTFYDVASIYNVLDPFENGRGTALSDVLYSRTIRYYFWKLGRRTPRICKKKKFV
jgi:hypothetical protein